MKDCHGRERVLTVMVSPDTRFAIGRGLNDKIALKCAHSVVSQGKAMTYYAVCLPAPAGSQLKATITNGAWDYAFAKPL